MAAYVPPRPGLLDADLDAIFPTHRKVILARDLNCKHTNWGSRLITASGRRLHEYATPHHIQTIGRAQLTYYPLRRGGRPDVLDIALIKGLDCPVQVFSLSELSSDHCPIMVHAATRHTVAKNPRPVVDWDRSKPAFERRFPVKNPLGSALLIDEAVARFDEALSSSLKMYTRMKPNLTPDYHRIPEEVRLLALEKNRLRRRWQRTRDQVDKEAYNRAADKLRRDMQVFLNSCWEFAVASMAESEPGESSVH